MRLVHSLGMAYTFVWLAGLCALVFVPLVTLAGSQTFTSSGTFTVPSYATLTVTVDGAGGGGGGGGGAAGTAGNGTSVSGEVQGIVSFEKDNVRVGGKPYYFAAFPPREESRSPVTIEAAIRNETGADARVSVRWQAYAWDQGRYENLVAQEEETVIVPARGRAQVSFTVEDSEHPVYLVVGTLSWQNTQSVINVRFVRQGVDRPRINFPAVTAFPLKAGKEATLFSCLHNAGESPVVGNGRLEIRLSDERGREIHEYVYEGDITGAMMGVASAFTPRRDYDKFALEAFLYRDGELVDDAHLFYDCAAIDPSSCLGVGESDTLGLLSDFLSGALWPIAAIGGVIAVLAAAVFTLRFMRRARGQSSLSNQDSDGSGF